MTEPLEGVIAGSTVAPVSMDDVPALTELMCRVSVAVIGEPDTTADEVRDDLIGPRFDISQDTVLVTMSDGRAVVYGQAYDEHDERGFIDVFVDPDFVDDVFAKVADLTVGACVARLRTLIKARGAHSTTAAAGLYQGETRMMRAYQHAGFETERVYWRMRIDLNNGRTFMPSLTDGVRIEQVDPDDDEVMSAALSVRNEAFRGHHGHVDLKFDEYAEVWRSANKYDRKGWWFAYLDDELVGISLNDDSKVDEGSGYVRTLGVKEAARGRGIAKALLLTTFADYANRGRTSVQLGVDAANETGATRLYESVGMSSFMALDALAMEVRVD
jgi:GNAT superfamily N-acetyltransferase